MSLQLVTLFACFFLSGFAALLYQTAWTRELSFVFGTSETAVVAVLAAYMGGLAFGSALAAKFAARATRPVLTYGLLEGSIAACGLLIPIALRGLNWIYVLLFGGLSSWPETRPLSLDLFQLASAFLVLLPPTALMGATLPLLARHAVQQDSEIASRVGALYVFNTAGAILGTLLTAFWLMPDFGLRHTVWIGAAVNAIVCVLAVAVARNPNAPTSVITSAVHDAGPDRSVQAEHSRFWILPAIALSGSLSFTLEVVWTRLLGHLVGGSLQAFASMLASFLFGITLGAALASRLATTEARARVGFAVSLFGLALFAFLSLTWSDGLVALAPRVGAGPGSALGNLAVAAVALLPTTICIGATFPFAIRIHTQRAAETARSTAQVYLWNTSGSILGALVGGYVLLPSLGYAQTVKLITVVAVLLAAATLAKTHLLTFPRGRVVAAIGLAAGLVLIAIPLAEPTRLLGSSPLDKAVETDTVVHAAVGRSASVLVSDRGPHYRLASNGLPESAIRKAGELPSAAAEHWLGFVSSLVRASTREMLVVGLGGGSALEFIPSSVEHIDVIELEPEILRANQKIGPFRAVDPLRDPRVRIHIGDARGSLRLIEKRYDAIVSQPSHPWTAGASHLYTREFFQLVRSRLTDEGIFVQWIGLPFLDEALLRSLIATVQETFPYVSAYRPDRLNLILAASQQPLDSLEATERSLARGTATFSWFSLDTIEDLASTWMLDSEGAKRFAAGAPLNTDDENRLASAASRLGKSRLTAVALERALLPVSPLAQLDGIDRLALVRQLERRRQHLRADDVARSIQSAPQRSAAMGALELARDDRRGAVERFEKALADDPTDFEVLSGVVAARRPEWIADLETPLPPGTDLHPALVAMVAAWRSASRNEWATVRQLDAELASFKSNDLLFEEATRLRIRARIKSSGSSTDATEATTLAERLVLRRWLPDDEILRAEAAAAAGDYDVTLSASRSAIFRTRSQKKRQKLAEKIRDLSRGMPTEARARVEALLESEGLRKDRNGKRAR